MNDLIIKSDGHWLIDPQAVSVIAEYTVAIKAAEKQLDELKTRLAEEMKAKNIIDLEADDGEVAVSVKYILPTDVETFDKKQFRKDHPALYDRYISMKKKAGYITVKVK